MKFNYKFGIIYLILFILTFLIFRSYDLLRNKHEKNRLELIKTNKLLNEYKSHKGISDQALSVISETLSGKKIENIIIKGNSLTLKKSSYFLPYISNTNEAGAIEFRINNISRSKKSSYIEKINNKFFIFFWSGKIIYLDKAINDLANDKIDHLKFINVPNNLNKHELVTQKEYWNGIKDALFLNGKIYLSYVKEVKKSCWNTSILVAEFNYDYLEFESFFTYEDCLIEKDEFTGIQSGGKLLNISEDEILLSIGDYRYRSLAQDPKSFFGKIIKINVKTQDHKIISMGHRNPQGLAKVNENIILVTEHGPKKGDEINKINLNIDYINQNFGWPISSYGEHYDGKFRSEAPLKKSHVNHGFIEPLFYFDTEHHGIGSILNMEKDDKYLMSSLKGSTLYILSLKNLETGKVEILEKFHLNNRIRDLEKISKNVYILSLEGKIPSLAIITLF